MTKSTKPIIRIHNVETDEVIEREMNEAELAQHEIDQANFAADRELLASKEAAKQAVLNKLGLSAEEVTVLLG